MPKNNKGKNAFHFFMLDWKKEQEKLGKSFPDGLRDVQRDPELSVDWADLSHERKAYYQSLAKDSKIKSQGSLEKRTALGESIQEVLLKEKKEQEFQQNMLDYIKSVISMSEEQKNLEKLKFIFIHVNWFYRREVGINRYDFCPAEFAVAEFSLDGGITNVYHEVINTKIPLGWRRDAIEMSQETHKIPVEHPDGQNDFGYMYEKLVQLLKSNMTGDKYPPMFTIKDMTPVVESLLRRMCDASHGNVDNFLIYSLEALFAELRNTAVKNSTPLTNSIIPLVVAENEFGKDVFACVSGLECEFHKLLDTPRYCSMSIVKRWGFTICDYCCEYMGIDKIDGIHCPMPQASFAVPDTIDLKLSQLSINDPGKTVSMSGVGSDYREKVSARSHKEEERRRNLSKPLEIIDHSKLNVNTQVLLGRPLRPPKTMAKAVSNAEENDLDNFPPLGGRGISVQKNNIDDMNFPPLGRGRGKYLQK